MRLPLLAFALTMAMAGMEAAECNGAATPGPRNVHPIDEAAPVFVKAVPHGKLYRVGQGDDEKDLLHLWGTPYDNGMAMGTLLGPKLVSFFNEVGSPRPALCCVWPPVAHTRLGCRRTGLRVHGSPGNLQPRECDVVPCTPGAVPGSA